jgi:hypothetical protein
LYKIILNNFYLIIVWRCKFLAKKAAHKILNIFFVAAFLVQKSFQSF